MRELFCHFILFLSPSRDSSLENEPVWLSYSEHKRWYLKNVVSQTTSQNIFHQRKSHTGFKYDFKVNDLISRNPNFKKEQHVFFYIELRFNVHHLRYSTSFAIIMIGVNITSWMNLIFINNMEKLDIVDLFCNNNCRTLHTECN